MLRQPLPDGIAEVFPAHIHRGNLVQQLLRIVLQCLDVGRIVLRERRRTAERVLRRPLHLDGNRRLGGLRRVQVHSHILGGVVDLPRRYRVAGNHLIELGPTEGPAARCGRCVRSRTCSSSSDTRRALRDLGSKQRSPDTRSRPCRTSVVPRRRLLVGRL